MVIEVFGRYAGFTAILPTMAGAANRCVIPEYRFEMEKLAQLLSEDRRKNPSRYSVVLVSEGCTFAEGGMVVEGSGTDAFGHAKLGGIGDHVSAELEESFATVQQRSNRQCDQPASWLSGPRRRPRRH